ncbi:cytochrome o ubiquinol oxidase subunit IV [Buchnera aphidicola (Macrosiphoniella sanborni)]|uniref:Cytochrome bo(3) ubiquinol oxidase subunit 4 n=1 Tax=Buchnera aphidicola (Macrosiphoniella sanborni) TaxID=1241865 RepID=A0A4D6YDE2_9GAMM|nr:cytochrome o ubiquinol oxidase subunit IV [Buchnera aphidicola]QCI23978.1 cytochrome o ubiquinol oxidase subunit IV [Buchnera aphidicola (Macrosiphoniella sanborni)]
MFNIIKLNINEETKSYFLGFLLSLCLTLIPFILAIKKFFSHEINYIIFLICAICQIFVHFVYFLHLNFSEEKKWHLITLFFVIIIIFIVIFGSIWIMHHLNHHIYHN